MDDANQQHAGRKRRWPRVLAAVAGLILLLVAAGWLYNLHWQHKVDALLASYRAKGEPVTWEEVLTARNKLPAEQNSALIFQGAFSQLEAQDSSAADALDSLLNADEPGARPCQRTTELLRAHIKDQAPVLAVIRKGAALQTGFYPVNSAADPYYYSLPYLSPLQTAVRLCCREAELRAQDGDGAGAVESLVAARRLSASLGECWLPVEVLLRISVDAIMGDAIEKSLGLCQFSSEGLARLRKELASGQAELSMRAPLLGERAKLNYSLSMLTTSQGLTPVGIKPTFGTRLTGWVHDHMPGSRSKDELFCYTMLDRYLAVADMPLPKQPGSIEELARELAREGSLHPHQYLISARVEPGLRHNMEAEVDARVQLGLADTALAVEQWRIKHGRWPDSLDELVPEELDSMPKDPYSGTSLGYRRTADGATVYSVGPYAGDARGVGDRERWGEPGEVAFRLLNPELRGAAQMSFTDEALKSYLTLRDLKALGVTADELKAAGVDPARLQPEAPH